MRRGLLSAKQLTKNAKTTVIKLHISFVLIDENLFQQKPQHTQTRVKNKSKFHTVNKLNTTARLPADHHKRCDTRT